MDPKEIAQMSEDQFNDRSFREKAHLLIAPDIVVVDAPASLELSGIDGYIQYSEGFVRAMPDIKGTIVRRQASGNKVTATIRGRGTFTGELQTPAGVVPGNGSSFDMEYQIEYQIENDKIKRFVVDYDMQEFQRQLGLS